VLSEVEEVCDRVAFLRGGRLVHTQVMADLRRRHRIRARLNGPLHPAPEGLEKELTIHTTRDGHVVIETPGELSPLLQWLSAAPLDQMTVEPVGLWALYERLHDGGLGR
jgi:ABC-2 type transport system ATP-binding protein